MLRGCVELGWAPELDWQLDACPVDFVASAIAAVASAECKPPLTIHLRNPRPARWTEAVLWMNLRGYPVQLEPYDRWAERIRRVVQAGHPLHALRAFLLRRTDGEDARYLPELYACPNVRVLRAERSDVMLGAMGVRCDRIGARLLERYFDHWVERGLVRQPVTDWTGRFVQWITRVDDDGQEGHIMRTQVQHPLHTTTLDIPSDLFGDSNGFGRFITGRASGIFTVYPAAVISGSSFKVAK